MVVECSNFYFVMKKSDKITKSTVDKSKQFYFDPERDVAEVVSGLAISINDVLRTGIIPDTHSDDALENGIDDPDNIIGRISDTFDSLEVQRAISKQAKRRNDFKQTDSVKSEPSSASSSEGVPSDDAKL